MSTWQRANTDWFHAAKWGVFATYLAGPAGTGAGSEDVTPDSWNAQIDAFDVDGLARQLAAAHVPYFFMSIGQNSGFYLSPNATYDSLVAFPDSKCSRRDLIADLYQGLEPYGIRLMVYLPSGAPTADQAAKERLMAGDDARTSQFQCRWEAVVREWSLRWGAHVHGWWIDGPYNPEDYRHPDPPNYYSLTAALKAGNPAALVAYNNGLRTPVYSVTECDDYTPGEIERDMTVSPGHYPDYSRLAPYTRLIDGAQFHILTIMGEWWGKPPLRFPEEFVIGYTRCINRQDGVVTWDVPLTPAGLIDPEFIGPLSRLGEAIGSK
ncbi:MAG: alpha-L-fucosidase [Armatimonadota bacterium]